MATKKTARYIVRKKFFINVLSQKTAKESKKQKEQEKYSKEQKQKLCKIVHKYLLCYIIQIHASNLAIFCKEEELYNTT